MAHITEWGEVISSNLGTETFESFEKKANSQTYGEMRLIEGQIRKVITADDTDPDQSTALFTLYECDVLYPDGNSGVLFNVRATQPLFGGSYNDFFEVLPADPGQDATDDSIDRSLKPGTHVLIGFIGGQKSCPVILGALPHFNELAVATRPTKDKAPGHLEGEFQGLNWSIDKEGAFKLNWGGPKDVDGNLLDDTLGPTALLIDKTGNVELSTNEKQTIRVDRVEKTITITSNETTITLEQDGEKISIKCKEVSVKTDGDCKFDISGDAEIKASGSVNISSDTGIQLQNGGSASEPFVLGNQLSSFLNELLATNLAVANVVGNLGVPTPPILTGPAIGAMAGRLQSLLSTHIKGI